MKDYVDRLHVENAERLKRLEQAVDGLRGLLWGVLASTSTLAAVTTAISLVGHWK